MELADSPSPVGRTLGRYAIEALIGRGGMGAVYRAHDRVNQRDVALKVLGSRAGQDAIDRFQREALWLSCCDDPHIVSIYETGRAGNVDYIAMELMSTTLQSSIASRGPTVEGVEDVASGILLALVAAHRAGILHRDVKPANVGISAAGQVKLLDFGVANALPWNAAQSECATIAPLSTSAGTLEYMPPEQLCGEPTDERADVYSAGAVLYEFVTGQPPFSGAHLAELIDGILNRAPDAPATLNPSVGPGLNALILRALDKKPWRRFRSAEAMHDALGHALAVDRGSAARPAIDDPAGSPGMMQAAV